MKYDIGDVFESIDPTYKMMFKSYTIVDRDLNDLTYKISYQDSACGDNEFSEDRLVDDVDCGYVSYTPFYKVVRSGTMEFSTSGNIPPRDSIIAKYENESYCSHPNKYLNKVFTMAFYVCPDCKKEV